MKQVQEIIQHLSRENHLPEIVLTDASGFPLAASTNGSQAEPSAAVAAMIQRVAEQARGHVGLAAMDEVVMNDEAGQRLVCRRFMAGELVLYLVIKAPPKVAYRRATNDAIRQIRAIWISSRA